MSNNSEHEASPSKRARSTAEGEIEIGGRRYVNVGRLASMLGVSDRTLSRWNTAGTGPARIKVGRKVLFDLVKVADWLTTRENVTSDPKRKDKGND